ncbi:MAG: DUF1150 family protein [Rhizobiales bacterium]|nr:DUF1150 family protein [Hyphomicrobiales bacterium]
MNTDIKKPEVSAQDLAILGGGTLGYIREIGATDAIKLLGPKINVPDDAKLFCLYAADGTPMSISGTREAAVANAMEHELLPVSVH